MEARIVTFPETRVVSLTHRGSPEHEHATVAKLIKWKIEQGLLDSSRYRHFGLHYADPRTTPASAYRVDFCLTVDHEVGANPIGLVRRVIPSQRCAMARDVGSRTNNQAAAFLVDEWLPASGETPSGAPMIFHYVNVGPGIPESEQVTDVYLPLLQGGRGPCP